MPKKVKLNRKSKWSDIQNNHIIDDKDCSSKVCLEAWKTQEDSEDGTLIACICETDDSFSVEYIDDSSKNDLAAQKAIINTINQMENNRK